MTDDGPTSESRITRERLEDRLRAAKLTPAQRQVARYIFDNQSTFVFLSAAELARHVGVSQPSVTRLAKQLGYQGYTELIADFRANLQQTEAPPEGANRFQKVLGDQIANLRSLSESLDDPRWLRDIAECIRTASTVVVFGTRISSSLAHDFAYRLARLRPAVQLLSHGGSASMDEVALGGLTEDPVLVVFSMPRYPAELLPIVNMAREQGYQVVQFTDTPLASLTASDDLVAPVPMSWATTFGSHAAAYALTAMVIDEVASVGDESVRERLLGIERTAIEEGHYLEY